MNIHVYFRFVLATVVIVIVLTLSYNTLDLHNYKPLFRKNSIQHVISRIQSKLLKPTLPPEEALSALCDLVSTKYSSQIISANFSKMKLVAIDDDKVKIAIQAYDIVNRPKTTGNDVILIWACNSDSTGCVAGDVMDYKNGSYTGYLRLFWHGNTTIHAKLASAIENTCLGMRALRKYGNVVFSYRNAGGIRGHFTNNIERELTVCGANDRIFGFSKVCNFTGLNGGIDWFCGHPQHSKLTCADIYSFESGSFDNTMVLEHEQIQISDREDFKDKITFDAPMKYIPLKTNQTSCKTRSPLISWTEPRPTGYWLRGQWNFANCISVVEHNNETYRQCLQSKYLVIIGESTLRHYAQYIIKGILGLVDSEGEIYDALGPSGETYHSDKEFKNHGIRLRYFKHELPFHNPKFPAKGISSVPQILSSIAEDRNIIDESLIILLNYYSHFAAYSPVAFRKRLNSLVRFIKLLLTNKPRAKVFFKGPHLSIMNRHFSQLYQKIIEEEFSSIMDRVTYLDVWSITVAHNSESLHPEGNAFISQINQFMAYLC